MVKALSEEALRQRWGKLTERGAYDVKKVEAQKRALRGGHQAIDVLRRIIKGNKK